MEDKLWGVNIQNSYFTDKKKAPDKRLMDVPNITQFAAAKW